MLLRMGHVSVCSDFAGGRAHQGISQSAKRVWKGVQEQVESQLREHKDYKLVLTGKQM